MPSPDSMRIIAVIAFGVLFVMGLKRPVWCAVAYMVLVLCKISFYYSIFEAIQAELLFAVIILVRLFVSGNFSSKLSQAFNHVNKYLFLFTLCVFLSFAVAWDYKYSWDNAVYHFIKSLILYVMVLVSIKNKKDLKLFIWSFIILFSYLAYEPMFDFLTGTGADIQMYGKVYTSSIGILSGHVALANNMNQMLPIVFYLILGIQEKKGKVLASIPLLIFFYALMASASRGGVMGFVMFSACVVFFSKRRLRNGLICGSLVLCLFIFSGRVVSTADRIDEHSVRGRMTGFTHGIGMLRKGNLLGVGPGCFLFARRKYFSYTMESHNIYGQVIGDLGIPGSFAWFFLIREVFRNLIAAKKKLKSMAMEKSFLYNLALGLQVSLVVRLFVSLASHGLYYFYWYMIAALSITVLKLVEDISKNNIVEQEPVPENQLGKYQLQKGIDSA